MDIEKVGGVSDHGAVNVVVLFLMFGEKLLWGGGSRVKKGVLYLCGGFWYVVVVQFLGVEAVVLGRVFPDESSELYRGVGLVSVV